LIKTNLQTQKTSKMRKLSSSS